ncbi:Bpu10I family restriction endonuclease [Litoreibacter roseus]|uniref:Bpu10I restriction endonuclease n=1 Tax=Litoreibacter roseus TaxID=2601869 RepID=A0A6N6JMU3_9RHOB|nr:Bpu10I family restriction endonuclease [Litoreibacter roseus]GFE67250.1 hypothetical protein KIN_43240 [Litoreibacter roseus]
MTKVGAIASIESLPHGSLLLRKSAEKAVLAPALAAYEAFVKAVSALEIKDDASVIQLVGAFNAYRRAAIPIFEAGKNVPQENLRSTMMEELYAWLFKDIFELLEIDQPLNFKLGKSTSSYVSLTFAPHNFASIFNDPNPRIAKKDQDFAIGATFQLTIQPEGGESPIKSGILIPIVAIECKTYLAKNHLDMCASTAASIKTAAPYCMYVVSAEFIKMDKGVFPELTDISEIFVLCRAKNGDRKKRRDAGLPPHDIHADLICDLFNRVIGHLRSIWWDPDSALKSGRVIQRPF